MRVAYNMEITTGFNEMIEKDIISHKELKLELCSIVGPVEIHLTLPQFCACLKPEPRNPYTEINTTKLSPSREDTVTLQNGWSYKSISTVYYYMGTFEAL
jgi:hypothetical protein